MIKLKYDNIEDTIDAAEKAESLFLHWVIDAASSPIEYVLIIYGKDAVNINLESLPKTSNQKPDITSIQGHSPSWDDAPEWANYKAMDSHGGWYWYQEKPMASKSKKVWIADRYDACTLKNWRDTLEERP